MKTAETQKQPQSAKSKASLSPELRELLHMLSSLESELGIKTTAAR